MKAPLKHCLSLAVEESSNAGRVPPEVIAMSYAEGPTVGSAPFGVVSQQEVAPTVRDLLSVISWESHAPSPSELESD